MATEFDVKADRYNHKVLTNKTLAPFCLKIFLRISSWADVYSFFSSCLDVLAKSKIKIREKKARVSLLEKAKLFIDNR